MRNWALASLKALPRHQRLLEQAMTELAQPLPQVRVVAAVLRQALAAALA